MLRWILSLIVAGMIVCPIAANGALIAHYNLDDPAGSSSIADTSGNGLNLTASNISLGATGIAGAAGFFQSSNSRGYAADNPDFRPSSFTLVAWVKPSALGQKVSIAGKETTAGASWGLEALADNQYNFFVFTTASNVDGTQSTTLASVGSWVQLIGVYDAVQGTTTLYVNGTPQGIQQGNFTGSPIYDTGAFDIGERLGGFNLPSFDGTIDDVQLYDQPLSSSDASYLYSHPGAVLPEPSSISLLLLAGVSLLKRRRLPVTT